MEAESPSILHQTELLVFVFLFFPFKYGKIKSAVQRCATAASQSQEFLNLFTP